MQARYFPNISEDQILLINRVKRTVIEDPDFLSDPKCPYPTIVLEFLRQASREGIEGDVPNLFEGDEVVAVEKQIQKLLNDLEAYGNTLTSADSSEKLQYFKTKNSLIEKLLTNLERSTNLKQINEFRSIVIQFMDEILTKDQVTTFMQRIDGVLSNGK